MPVKFQCPKCERRFVEWGAQKLNFKCPNCAGQELLRVGSAEGHALQPPRLKRRPAKVGKAPVEAELDFADMDVVEEEEVVDEGGITELEFGVDHVVIDEEVETVGEEMPLDEEAQSGEAAIEGADSPVGELGEELVFDDEAALDLGETPEDFEEER